MKYSIISFMVFFSINLPCAFATDITGNIDLGGQYLETRGEKAKFNEYRDIDSGIFGKLNLDINLKDYYLSVYGDHIGWNYNKEAGLDNQYYTIKGGKYDYFKYSLFYDETPHNITFGAKSAFSGVGSGFLVNDVSDTTLPLNSFDYGAKRKAYGGSFEGSFDTPFFFGVKVDRTEIRGILPAGFGIDSDLGGLELPAPVRYNTENLNMETGYRSRNIIFKIDGALSFFNNENQMLQIDLPAGFAGLVGTGGNQALYYRPPNNTYYKVGGSLTVRLPLNSSFMVHGSYAKLENDQSLIETGQKFNGDISYSDISAAIASNPVKPLTLRLYYNYLERNNGSTSFIYTTAPGGTESPSRYQYNKHWTGIDIGYRLPARTNLDSGYEYQQVNRHRDREDGVETRDHIIFAQVKNSYFDWMSVKVRYQHLSRSSDVSDLPSITDPYYTTTFRRFDVADKDEDIVKTSFDFQPLDRLNLGLEYNYKLNHYENLLLGVKKDTRHEIYADASYAFSILKLSGYFDMELVKRVLASREVDVETFDWASNREDTSYTYGFKADVDIIRNILTAQAGWRFEKAFGSNDFSFPGTVASPPQNIGVLDNFSRQTISAKLGYRVTKQLLIDLGYMFERLKYDDDAWRAYQYLNSTGAGTGVFLTGAYANPGYQAHVAFLKLNFSF